MFRVVSFALDIGKVSTMGKGAWLVAIIMPAIYLLMHSINHHYSGIDAAAQHHAAWLGEHRINSPKTT
jgi:hypothetical protein